MTAEPLNDNLPGENNHLKGEDSTSAASQNPPQSSTSGNKSAPQSGAPDGCPVHHVRGVGLEEGSASGEVHAAPDKNEEVEEKIVKQGPVSNGVPPEKVVPPSAASQEVHSDDQDSREPVRSPTAAEKRVKITTIVSLQSQNLQTIDSARSDQTTDKVAKQLQTKKKTMVLVSLQKEITPDDSPKDSPPASQQNKSMMSGLGLAASSPHPNPSPLSPGLTCSSQRPTREAAVQLSRDQANYTEEGSLSPDIRDDEGPPPPPPLTSKMALHMSKTGVRGQSIEEDLAIMTGSDVHTVVRDRTLLAYENQGWEENDGYDNKPIIVILNEPMDMLAAYKRLSTIFEYDEDLDVIRLPERIVHKEETELEEIEQDYRKLTDTGSGLKVFTGNGQNSLQKQPQKPKAGGVAPDDQDPGEPDSRRKAETKRKFKFKFPKNKLASLSQAIRSGTSRTGKKAVEVVVYEEEEEMASNSRRGMENKKRSKETKRFEINSNKQSDLDRCSPRDKDFSASSPSFKSQGRSQELCRHTSDSINGLEVSIKQLEISMDSLTPSSPSSTVSSTPPASPDSPIDSNDRVHSKGNVKRGRERSPSKRPASQIIKGPNPPQSKRAKPQPPQNTVKPSTKKQVWCLHPPPLQRCRALYSASLTSDDPSFV